MKFNIHLSMDYNKKDYGGDRIYDDMVKQAVLADNLGYDAVSVTEHHLLNIGMQPAPLQAVVKIAERTKNVKILTAVVILPLHDMRSYAGEVIVTDIMANGRLILGVGRGAYAFEMERFGIAMDETRARFDESLDVLQALLTQEEVSWDGDYYKFDALTVMPRPLKPEGPALLMAVMNPKGIYHCTKRGFHILTTPLAGNHQLLVDQVEAFTRARGEMGETGKDLTLTLSRTAFVVDNAAQRQKRVDEAYDFFSRFDNVYTGPGIVDNGMVRSLPRKQTKEEMAESLLICGAQEMVDRLTVYSELGIDRVSLMVNVGAEHNEVMENIERIAKEVMPHFEAAPAQKTTAVA
ncbi:MAG: LLM class flavin-dependent oxidoreductase [Pseudomonadota bacterium]